MNEGTVEASLSRGSMPIGRGVFAAALLIAEYVIALLVFDSERMPVAGETDFFRNLGEAMPLVIVVMTATLIMGSGSLRAELAEAAAAFREPRRIRWLLVGHLLTYAIAIGITVFVFNPGRELERPWLWVAAWAVSGVFSLLLLVAVVLPRSAVRPLVKPVIRAVAVGALVGALALAAGYATSFLWLPLSRMTLDVVAVLLRVTGHDVASEPEYLVLGTPTYEVFIDEPCSGYEGIGLMTVMLGSYLVLVRRSLKFPNALLLLPIGMALIWLANSVRIAALISIGTWISPDIAEGGFHSAAGWLMFCVIALGLVAVSREFRWFTLDEAPNRATFLTPEGAYLLPLLFLIATGLVTALFSAGFDNLYPLRIIAALIPLWIFRGFYDELRWSWSWTPLVLGVLTFVLWVLLEPPADAAAAAVIPDALSRMPRAAAVLWLIARAFGSVVVVPIAEELAFRGYLLRRLIDADFTAVSPRTFTVASFFVSSFAFGVLHGRWLAGILAGMLFAAAQYKRGEISDAIIAHAVTNGLLAAYVLGFDQWIFW